MSVKSQKREKRRKWGLLVAGVLVAGALSLAGAFWATQRIGERRVTVCRTGCDFAKISEAIAALPSPSTIVLRPGVYAESVIIERPLSLLGEDLTKTTIAGEITVRNAQNVTLSQITLQGSLHVQAGREVRLEKLEITGGGGDGLAVSNSTAVRVKESQITDHKADGLAITSSEVELEGNLIGGNGGCGIRADGTSRVLGGKNRSGGAQVPQDFQTIQEAINAWQPGMGPNSAGNLCGPLAPALLTGTGAIVIAPGIYRERLTIRDKAVYLRGAGIDETILDGSGFGDIDGITLRGEAKLTLEGFTVRNFRDDGLDAEGPIELTILKSAFIANKSNGLEIAHDKVRLRLQQSIVRENRNYGLWVLGIENIVECRENTISDNGTNYGGLSPDIAAMVMSKCQGEL